MPPPCFPNWSCVHVFTLQVCLILVFLFLFCFLLSCSKIVWDKLIFLLWYNWYLDISHFCAAWFIINRICSFLLSWTKALDFLHQVCLWFQEYLLSQCLQSIYMYFVISWYFLLPQDAYPCCSWLLVTFPCLRITNGVPQALKLFQNKAFTCEYK